METYHHKSLGVLKSDTANGYDVEGADFVVIQHCTDKVIGYIVDSRTDVEGVEASEKTTKDEGAVYTIYNLNVEEVSQSNVFKAAIKLAGDEYAG